MASVDNDRCPDCESGEVGVETPHGPVFRPCPSCSVPLPGEGEWKCTGWDGQEPTYERVEATAEPSAAPTDSGANQTEGEGELEARIEAKARVLDSMAQEQADEFGNFITGPDGIPGQYKEGRADAFDLSAQALRSLLVPKEEA